MWQLSSAPFEMNFFLNSSFSTFFCDYRRLIVIALLFKHERTHFQINCMRILLLEDFGFSVYCTDLSFVFMTPFINSIDVIRRFHHFLSIFFFRFFRSILLFSFVSICITVFYCWVIGNNIVL